MKRHVFCCSSFSDFSFCQPDGHQSKINHWGCKYETDHNWELLFRTLQWWYFGKYKYISNKGELKGNHRGSRSPFQIQGLGDTEITGGMNTGSVTSRKFSRSIYGSWKIRICRLCVSWIIKKIEAHVKGSFKKYFLEQWGRHAHAKNLQHKYVPQFDSKSCWIMVVRIDHYNSVHHDSLDIFYHSIGTGWRAGINNLSKKGLGMKKTKWPKMRRNFAKCWDFVLRN